MATLAFGLIAGFALGGVGPRRELGALQKRYEQLERRMAEMERPDFMANFLPTLSEVVRAPATEPSRVTTNPDAGSRGLDGGAATGPEAGVVQTVSPSPMIVAPMRDAGVAPAPRLSDEDEGLGRHGGQAMLAGFDQAVTAQQARAAATRATLIDQARLNPEQIKALDLSVNRMNQQLGGYGDKVLSLMESEDAPSATDALEVGHKVSGILLEHQRELDAILSGAQGEMAKEDSARQVWNLVDLEAFRPAVERRLGEGDSPSTPPMGTAGAPGGESP